MGPLDITESSKTSVTLSWLPPPSDGGAALSGYVVERKEKTSPVWSRVARVKPQTTTYTVSNLMDGFEYMFRVFAENMEGLGVPLTTDRTVAPRGPAAGKPSAPSGYLRAKKLGGDSVLVEWGAPLDDGGKRVTSYVVEYREADSVTAEGSHRGGVRPQCDGRGVEGG